MPDVHNSMILAYSWDISQICSTCPLFITIPLYSEQSSTTSFNHVIALNAGTDSDSVTDLQFSMPIYQSSN